MSFHNLIFLPIFLRFIHVVPCSSSACILTIAIQCIVWNYPVCTLLLIDIWQKLQPISLLLNLNLGKRKRHSTTGRFWSVRLKRMNPVLPLTHGRQRRKPGNRFGVSAGPGTGTPHHEYRAFLRQAHQDQEVDCSCPLGTWPTSNPSGRGNK